MKRAGSVILIAVVVLTVPACAWASPSTMSELLPRDGDVVVNQQPTRVGGGASDTLLVDRDGQVTWQQLADEIVLTQTATIGRIGWWGFYGTWNQTHVPPATEMFRIRLYDARAGDGLPGVILFEQTFDAVSRTATGRNVLAEEPCPEYFYQINLSQGLTFAAGVRRWLEVVQVGDVGSTYRWELANGPPPGQAYLNPNVTDWALYYPNCALQLSTVPEPGSLFLFVSSLFLVRLQGRRR